ncbi:MAG: hypothetical protein EBT83_11355 [Betaproteobacteria bacterium]|nr:hypothetical protein [Betaproteobacteria bacterium]
MRIPPLREKLVKASFKSIFYLACLESPVTIGFIGLGNMGAAAARNLLRGGYALMPEWETRPANRYLPRKPTGTVAAAQPGREDPRSIDGTMDGAGTAGQS